MKDNVTELEQVASKRVGISLEKYQNLIRDELWLTANSAVKSNHADKITYARCDKSLSGTYSQVIRTFFGTFHLEFSKCPLVTGIVGIKVPKKAKLNYVRKIVDQYTNIRDYVTTEL